jgi:hypothetical protein
MSYARRQLPHRVKIPSSYYILPFVNPMASLRYLEIRNCGGVDAAIPD